MSKVVDTIAAVLKGFRDPVTVRDGLSIKFTQAPKVYCVKCKTHIYYLKTPAGDQGGHVFAPSERYRVRDDMICPHCGCVFCAYMGGAQKIRTDRGWM